MLAAAAAPPIYGFGVDADAGAAKLYVQNRYGEAPPQLPAAAEAAMPPVFSNGTREPPRTLSLEWRVGEATTALRVASRCIALHRIGLPQRIGCSAWLHEPWGSAGQTSRTKEWLPPGGTRGIAGGAAARRRMTAPARAVR